MEIYRGDCLDVLDQLGEGSVDMVLADPPYGCTRNGWDEEIGLSLLWPKLRRVCREDAAMLLFASDRYAARLVQSNEREFRYNLVWHKTQPTGFLNARRMPLRAHENVCVFYRRLPVYDPQMGEGPRKVSSASHKRGSRRTSNYGDHESTDYDSTNRFPTSVLTFPTDKQRCPLHPTQKPVALLEYLVRTYTHSGGRVLDFCMGSGSTGVACARSGRRFVGIEADEAYFETARRRLEAEESQGRLF